VVVVLFTFVWTSGAPKALYVTLLRIPGMLVRRPAGS